MNRARGLEDALLKYAPRSSVFTSADQSVTLMRSFFAAHEGELQPGQHLKLGMCMSDGGSIRYRSGNGESQFRWRQGGLLLTAPDDDSEIATPDVDMIGLAIDLSSSQAEHSALAKWALQKDHPAHVLEDDVIRSVLVALWSSAEFHASSSAFIEHGVEIILQRALTLGGKPHVSYSANKLSRREMEIVRDFIDANLANNIRVADLSDLVSMSPNRFTKALQATIGLAPYAYMTARRMESAKALLAVGTPATETALFVGYTNPSKFSAAFKRFVGCAPSEWKRLS